jgi:S-adenosylmethionine hydrolase
MIVLFTDFGLTGPYVGQVKAVLARTAPGVPVIDLFADAPAHDPRLAAYLLAAFAGEFPSGSVFLAVVDPGVGGPRRPLAVQADGRWYVGPDNGLFELVVRRARSARCVEIAWRPERLSASFHGRDLFAPVAAELAKGHPPPGPECPLAAIRHPELPDDLAQVVYVDGFGNAMTGLRATAVPAAARLVAGGCRLARAGTFSDVSPGDAFWYENANGLVEIAVNQGRADRALGLGVGAVVAVEA